MSETQLVLLPGMLCDGVLFEHQVTHLSEVAGVKVGDMTGGETVAEVACSILRSAPERFALCGLSLGGIVAFEMMRQAPERVVKLALLDTNARPPMPQQRQSWRTFAAMTADGRFGEVIEGLVPVQIHPDRLRDEALTATITRMAEDIGEGAFLRQLAVQASRADSREGLSNISCPTLVVVGRQDALCSMEMHEEIAAAIPDATLVVIEECGHLSSLEQPQAVTALLRYWLQRGG